MRYGAACRVDATQPESGTLDVRAFSTFRDAWTQFRPENTGQGHWAGSLGGVRHVPMMMETHLTSVATWKGLTIVALPFRDVRFALILVTGSPLSNEQDAAYFNSGSFRGRQGFRDTLLTLSMPRLNLASSATFCERSCHTAKISQEIRLAIDERGAGDAPILPRDVGKLMDPNKGLIYTKYSGVSRKVSVTLNQPFCLAIVDTATQATLFKAFVSDPSQH
jgi:serine protease inhibitor